MFQKIQYFNQSIVGEFRKFILPGGTPDSISADLAGPGPFLVDAYTDMVYLVVAFRPVMV